MTANHPGRSGNPAKRANPGLDQLAAQIRNDRIGRNPVIVELEGVEQQLVTLFSKVGAEHVEPEQAGATMLIMGQLFNDLISKLGPDDQFRAPAIIVNLLRMLGQRLYSGDLPVKELQCPFLLPHGAPCAFKPTYTMGGTLTAVMQGHVALHHPGQVWPPVDGDQADADDEPELVNGPKSAQHPSIDEPKQYELAEAVDEVINAPAGDEVSPYRDAGTSDELKSEQPFDGSPFEGVRTFHPDGTVTYHDEEARGELPDEFAPQLKPGDIGLVGPGSPRHFEPGFNPDGSLAEISVIDDPTGTPPAMPRVPADQCEHPKHARMHLPGGERCCACGTPVDPDGTDA